MTTPSSESEAVMSVAGPSGTNVTMSMTVRKQVNQTSSGATKRGEWLFGVVSSLYYYICSCVMSLLLLLVAVSCILLVVAVSCLLHSLLLLLAGS